MSDGAQRWGAAIVHHGAFEDLERCLASLGAQTRPPASIAVYDTGVDAERMAAFASRHPHVHIVVGPNRGYAGGANRAIEAARASAERPLAHVLVMNPDVELEPDFADRLIDALGDRPEIAIAGGKLLRRDRKTIDSAGIEFPRHRRPRDRGSELPDEGQFERLESVAGISGAAMWIRTRALEALSVEGELFDEVFFAYHEDTDLCWRARRLGFEVLYVPEAVGIHARGWQRDRRAAIPISVRRHSFKNHYLQLVKNETAWGALRNAPWLLAWEGLRLGFVLLRDRPLLPAYANALRALPRAWRWRRILNARVKARAAARKSAPVL